MLTSSNSGRDRLAVSVLPPRLRAVCYAVGAICHSVMHSVSRISHKRAVCYAVGAVCHSVIHSVSRISHERLYGCRPNVVGMVKS